MKKGNKIKFLDRFNCRQTIARCVFVGQMKFDRQKTLLGKPREFYSEVENSK